MSKLNVVPVSNENEALTQAVLSYKELKAKIAFLENELKPHKEVLELAASKTKDGIIQTPDFKITLTVAQRETFSLKQARITLPSDALEALEPFISVSMYMTLRVS